MIVGVLKEARTGETRVAATPTTVAALQEFGYQVAVGPGAGESATFTDEACGAAGARLGDLLTADLVTDGYAKEMTAARAATTAGAAEDPSSPIAVCAGRLKAVLPGSMRKLGSVCQVPA